MLQVFRPPEDLAAWLDGGVAVHLDAATGRSRFPAMPHAMLSVRLVSAACGLARWRLLPPIAFHTLATGPTEHAHGDGFLALGLLVRPAAAACLLGAATGALVDRALDWGTLAGEAEAARVQDEVEAARSNARRLAALAASLRRTLDRVARGRDAGIERLCALVGRHGVLAAAELGIGPRQLERRCQALLGLAPKSFQRVVRVHQSLSRGVMQAGTPMAPTGAELALEAGYYDQSHLARDLRRLAGAPLQSLLAEARAGAPGWPLASHRLLRQVGGCAAPGRVRHHR